MRLECRNQKAFEPVVPATAIYPWWQSCFAKVVWPSGVGTRMHMRRIGGYDNVTTLDFTASDHLPEPFTNVQPWAISAEGIAFVLFSSSEDANPAAYCSDLLDIGIRSSRYGALISPSLPFGALATTENATTIGVHARRVFRLPAPYRLSKDEQLDLAVWAGFNQQYATGFQFALRGRDPYSCSPVIRTCAPLVLGGYNEVPVQLDDSRDRSTRAIDVHDIVFAGKSDVWFEQPNETNYAAMMPVRIGPPHGPKWTDDVMTPTCLLDSQLDRGAIGPIVRQDLRFAAPLKMLPGDRITLYPKVLSPLANTQTLYLFAILYGRQEVPRDRAR